MTRPVLYVFSKAREMKDSLSRFVRYVYIQSEEGGKHEFDSESHAVKYSNIDEIISILNKRPSADLLNTAVILDVSGADQDASWNPAKKDYSNTDIAATLALMYPEIYWIFIGLENNEPAPAEQASQVPYGFYCHFTDPTEMEEGGIKKIDCLLRLHRDSYRTLFDPSGMRFWLKRLALNKIERTSFPERASPVRDEIAASIDEEDAYVYMHSYLAYRMGYRCYPISCERIMKKVFSSEKGGLSDTKVAMTFEDIFINFPDKSSDLHLSNLQARDNRFKKLKDVKKRIFVTVGHKYIDWYDRNTEYLRELQAEGKTIKTVFKPSGGVYNLLRESGLLNKYWQKQEDKRRNAAPKEENPEPHSAPGKLLEIAESLIGRSRKIFEETRSVQECIQGAVFSLEARDILNFKTPTTCLEAIVLRHKLEVKAECMFYGVEYNIDVRNRFKEIEGEINAVSNWFHPKRRESSSLNAKMSIVTEIMRIFENYGQFDEQQECLVYLRKLNRKWYFSRKPQLKFLQFFRWYIETLVGSIRYFVVAILLWPLLGGFISFNTNATFGEGKNIVGPYAHIVNSFSTFYGIQPVEFPISPGAKVITVLLMTGGFIHLGIFISHLYTLITRGK